MINVLTDEKRRFLNKMAMRARVLLIDMLADAGSGHTAGPLGMADVFTALYFGAANVSPNIQDDDMRDRIFLSNGHIVPIRYVVMALAGFIPISEIYTLREFGSRLQGHPERVKLPSLESTSGPLGSGLSQAAGAALGLRMKYGNRAPFVFCLMSDGEMDAGNIWEGAMFASKYRLGNLIGVIDRNNIQINGSTEDVMPLEPLADKWRAFGWHVIEIDGHNFDHIFASINEGKSFQSGPTVVIAHTIPGRGVRTIENDYRWHGAPPGKGPDDVIPRDKQRDEFIRQILEFYGESE